MSIRRILPIFPALLTGAAFAWAPTTASAGGGFPPVLNCLTNVCTLLTSDAQDSDGDGFTDADEKAFGSDPYYATSTPPVRWVFDRIADETLPGFWLEPQIDLLTITPDGHAITVDIKQAMGSLGLALPTRAGDFHPESMAPAGVDLGQIGNTLDWQVHGETSTSLPSMPDAPDPSLYGAINPLPSELHVKLEKGDVYVQNGFDHGEFTSSVQVYDADGKRGMGSATASNPWEAQTKAINAAVKDANGTPEAATAIDDAVTAEEKQRIEEQRQREKEAKEKEAKEKEKKDAKHDEEKKDHGLRDPDAGEPVGLDTLTTAQIEALIAAGSGSYFTHVGDTGVLAMVTLSDYRDPTLFIIHVNPDADPLVINSTPDLGGQAGPEYDPNRPQGPTGTIPPSGTNS